jgi:chromosome segregation ATPase
MKIKLLSLALLSSFISANTIAMETADAIGTAGAPSPARQLSTKEKMELLQKKRAAANPSATPAITPAAVPQLSAEQIEAFKKSEQAAINKAALIEADFAALKIANDKRDAQLQSVTKEKDDLGLIVTNLESNILDLQMDNKALNQTIIDSQALLDQKKSELAAALGSAKRVQRLEEENAKLIAIIDKSKVILEKNQDTIKELSAKFDSLTVEHDKLKAKILEREKQIVELNEENQGYTHAFDSHSELLAMVVPEERLKAIRSLDQSLLKFVLPALKVFDTKNAIKDSVSALQLAITDAGFKIVQMNEDGKKQVKSFEFSKKQKTDLSKLSQQMHSCHKFDVFKHTVLLDQLDKYLHSFLTPVLVAAELNEDTLKDLSAVEMFGLLDENFKLVMKLSDKFQSFEFPEVQ